MTFLCINSEKKYKQVLDEYNISLIELLAFSIQMSLVYYVYSSHSGDVTRTGLHALCCTIGRATRPVFPLAELVHLLLKKE